MNRSRQLLAAAAAFAALILVAPAAFGQMEEPNTTGTNAPTGGTADAPTGGTTDAPTGAPTGGAEGTPGGEAVDAEELAAEIPAIYLAPNTTDVATSVSGLSTRLDRVRTTGDIGIKLNCWVHKLGDANVDDRVIQWSRICPSLQTGPGRASSVCEPPMTVPEESLYQGVKTLAEVEPANNQLHFFAHVKSEVVDLQKSFPNNDRDQFVVDQLLHLIRDVEKANKELDAMAASTEHGGIPRHYRALREWITRKTSESNSLYSPCS